MTTHDRYHHRLGVTSKESGCSLLVDRPKQDTLCRGKCIRKTSSGSDRQQTIIESMASWHQFEISMMDTSTMSSAGNTVFSTALQTACMTVLASSLGMCLLLLSVGILGILTRLIVCYDVLTTLSCLRLHVHHMARLAQNDGQLSEFIEITVSILSHFIALYTHHVICRNAHLLGLSVCAVCSCRVMLSLLYVQWVYSEMDRGTTR